MDTPTLSISIRQETANAIQQGDDSVEDFLLEDIESSKDEFIKFLKSYEGEKDANGQVYGYDEIDAIDVDNDGFGGFTVYFTVNVYSGCRDINNDTEEEILVSIEVDFDRLQMKLTGEDLMPQRDPDEY